MLKRIHHWLQAHKFFKTVAIFATFFVIFLSLKPPNSEEQPWNFLFIRGDLVLHFTCYLGLTGLYFSALYTHEKAPFKAFIYALIVGTLLEFTQLIPFLNRYFDFLDLLANLLGALFAWRICNRFFYYSNRI